MRTKQRPSHREPTIRLSGDLDFESSPKLRRWFRARVCDCSPVLLLDMSEVRWMDSSGAATLLEHYHNSRRYQGRILLAGVNRQALSLLELLGLRELFEVFPDMESARQVIRRNH